MTTDTNETRTITLTDRAPVRITDAKWPVIASGSYSWHDNQYEFQANRKCSIFVKVRRHEDDGRHLIYAGYTYSTQFQNEEGARHRTGEVVDAGEDIIEPLKRVMRHLAERAGERENHIRDCLDECIADLPPVDL